MNTARLLLLALLLAAPLRAQTLPNGTYRVTAEIGAVLLDGRYPLVLTDVPPGEIEITTAPGGIVTGRAIVAGQPIDVKGTAKARQGYMRLTLGGRVEGKKFSLKATLQGGAFVGTLKLGAFKSACQFDASASGAVKPACVLMLTVAANGAISGPGTLFLARQQVAVNAKGRLAKSGVVSLTIKGPKVSLKLTGGTIAGTTVTFAKWTGQGFGALAKGVNLRVTKDP